MTTVVAVVPAKYAIQYNGANSADIEAAIPDFTVTSESGGTLYYTSGSNTDLCPTGSWLIWEGESGAVIDRCPDATYVGRFMGVPQQSGLVGIQDQIDGLSEQVNDLAGGAPLEAAGIASFTAALNGNTVVPVTIEPAMPDSSYTVNTPQIFGGVNLGNLSVAAVAIVDENTVNVTVHNSGLVALGANVLVTASA